MFSLSSPFITAKILIFWSIEEITCHVNLSELNWTKDHLYASPPTDRTSFSPLAFCWTAGPPDRCYTSVSECEDEKKKQQTQMCLSFFGLFFFPLLEWQLCLWAEKVAPALILWWDLSSHVRLFFLIGARPHEIKCSRCRCIPAESAALCLLKRVIHGRAWLCRWWSGFFSNQYIRLCM